MSTEQNKALVRRFIEEVITRGNMSLVDEMVAPDYVGHPTPPGLPPGREGFKMMNTMMFSAFSDAKTLTHDIIADDDKVAVNMTHVVTHTGEFMGLPPTGKSISVGEICVLRIADGKIAEYWGQVDNTGMMQQLGAIPAPEPGGH